MAEEENDAWRGWVKTFRALDRRALYALWWRLKGVNQRDPTVADVEALTAEEILSWEEFGVLRLARIEAALAARGKGLRPSPPSPDDSAVVYRCAYCGEPMRIRASLLLRMARRFELVVAPRFLVWPLVCEECAANGRAAPLILTDPDDPIELSIELEFEPAELSDTL